MKKVFQNIATILIVLAIAGGILYHFWSVNQLEDQIKDDNSSYSASIKYYSDSLTNVQELVNKLGDTITFVKQQNMTLEAAYSAGLLREGELKENYLKSVNTIVKLKEEISILNKPGEYTAPVIVSDSGCVKFPIPMYFGDKYFQLGITARASNPVLDSLKVFLDPTILLGYQRPPGLKNAFKPKQPIATYKNDNPHVKVSDMLNIQITDEKKWYETTGFKIGAGILVGSMATHYIMK
ncbi:MAG: hypothetical protein PF450_03880 [Bacteroidales bacterium]|jgi:hypothetical protein|nr:hypothetical protein [Bacteroidales bacterium]